MKTHDKLYIDGKWAEPDGAETLDVYGAATEEVIAGVPAGSVLDAERAVAAARAAFDSWSLTPITERLGYLDQLRERIEARKDELAATISSEVGTPLGLSKVIQVGGPIGTLRSLPALVAEFPFEEQVGRSTVVREPIGVVGVITAWNYPLTQVVGKACTAMAAGCTVVVKPSEVAPLTAFVVAEILDEIGLPAGVFNLVTGLGPVVGEAIVGHGDVDMITLTGSTGAGRRVAEVAARTVKRVALELGGKSANVILDDADLQKAVTTGVENCFFNSGQTCTAWSRMLVPRSRLSEVEEIARERAARFTIGDPLVKGTTIGPLATAEQRERVRGYIQKGLDEGAVLVVGGADPPDVPAGYFVTPTIFSGVRNDMTIASEEIFGPVLSIIPYDTEDEAVAIANDTIYGLAGAVWSQDDDRAVAVARRLRTGQVDINGTFFNPLAPFGGYKQSGIGRELGRYGLDEFLETKSLQR